MGAQSGVFDDIEGSEFDDSDETTDADGVTGSESRLAIGNIRSDDCTRLRDCGEGNGDENDFNDGGERCR